MWSPGEPTITRFRWAAISTPDGSRCRLALRIWWRWMALRLKAPMARAMAHCCSRSRQRRTTRSSIWRRTPTKQFWWIRPWPLSAMALRQAISLQRQEWCWLPLLSGTCAITRDLPSPMRQAAAERITQRWSITLPNRCRELWWWRRMTRTEKCWVSAVQTSRPATTEA